MMDSANESVSFVIAFSFKALTPITKLDTAARMSACAPLLVLCAETAAPTYRSEAVRPAVCADNVEAVTATANIAWINFIPAPSILA